MGGGVGLLSERIGMEGESRARRLHRMQDSRLMMVMCVHLLLLL